MSHHYQIAILFLEKYIRISQDQITFGKTYRAIGSCPSYNRGFLAIPFLAGEEWQRALQLLSNLPEASGACGGVTYRTYYGDRTPRKFEEMVSTTGWIWLDGKKKVLLSQWFELKNLVVTY